jgi:hypothetical protein
VFFAILLRSLRKNGFKNLARNSVRVLILTVIWRGCQFWRTCTPSDTTPCPGRLASLAAPLLAPQISNFQPLVLQYVGVDDDEWIGGIYRQGKSEVLLDVSLCCFTHMVLLGLNPGPRFIVAGAQPMNNIPGAPHHPLNCRRAWMRVICDQRWVWLLTT